MVRPMLTDRYPACLCVLSVMLVYCRQTAKWITIKLGSWHGGRPPPSPHCVRWGPSSPKRGTTAPQFSVHVCCGQTAGWIKMSLGM